MIVRRADSVGPIAWECNSCSDSGSDSGRISGWEDSPYDLRLRRPRSTNRVNQIRIPDEVAATLRDLSLLDPECERVVYLARAHDDDVVLTAGEDDLEELTGYVAAEANHATTNRTVGASNASTLRLRCSAKRQRSRTSPSLPPSVSATRHSA